MLGFGLLARDSFPLYPTFVSVCPLAKGMYLTVWPIIVLAIFVHHSVLLLPPFSNIKHAHILRFCFDHQLD